MITPEEIKKKAERRYVDVLRAAIEIESVEAAASEPVFPLDLPVGRSPKNYPDLLKAVTLLIDSSKASVGFGYTLELETKNTRKHGPQSLPKRVYLAEEQDYLLLLQKEASFAQFKLDADMICAAVPALASWIYRFPLKVIENSRDWPDLIKVCQYFQQNPKPNLYLRELPIAVHTKFIEEHQDILRSLLEAILSDDQLASVEGRRHTFEKRFSIRYPEPLLRLRILDADIQQKYGFPIADFSLTLSDFHQLQLGQPRCFISENLMPFLTLPHMENAVAIFGSGYAVGRLKAMSWLAECPIFYWGDMDVDGFKILSQVRSHFPQTQSVMMDKRTYKRFQTFVVSVSAAAVGAVLHLSEEESKMCDRLAAEGLRLEQERMSQAYVNEYLRRWVL